MMRSFLHIPQRLTNVTKKLGVMATTLGLLVCSMGANFSADLMDKDLVQENLIQGFEKSTLMKQGHYKVGKSYKIKGVKYTPKSDFYYKEEGLASWYGPGFHGKKTANGEKFDMYSISAAHKTLQMPCVAKVTNLENGKTLMVRINDRGPFHKDNRIIDLSKAAAKKLGFKDKGVAKVRVEVMTEESVKLAANCQGKEICEVQRNLKKIS